jgi:Flp pilus assembly protein TadG
MGNILSGIRHPVAPVSGLLRNRSGATAVTVALALTAVLGFAGLGTEAASWYYTKRNMQSAADAAAATAGASLATT